MREPLPLATIHAAILEFLRGRSDAILFGAHAVNAYVDEPRMTQDVDVMSPRAEELVEELRSHLTGRFHVALRVRRVAGGAGFRLFQVRKPKNRHLVDVRSVAALPPARNVGGLLVVSPEELVASKLVAFQNRRGTPKSGTDWRDLAELLLAFPKLKTVAGPVRDRLVAGSADAACLAAWAHLVAQEIRASDDDT